jgi:hypothetical protein
MLTIQPSIKFSLKMSLGTKYFTIIKFGITRSK